MTGLLLLPGHLITGTSGNLLGFFWKSIFEESGTFYRLLDEIRVNVARIQYDECHKHNEFMYDTTAIWIAFNVHVFKVYYPKEYMLKMIIKVYSFDKFWWQLKICYLTNGL